MSAVALFAVVAALAASSASAATDPCSAAITAARADLDQTGLQISQAQKQLATILLASRGHLNQSELRQAIAQLEQLDAAAAAILPSGQLQHELARRAAICERRLHAPSA